MLFNSLIYLVFLAVVATGLALLSLAEELAPALRRFRLRRAALLIGSYAFYASWHWTYLALLMGVAAVNHFGAMWIVAGPANRKRRGAILLTANIGLLALFKYLDWLIGNVNAISAWIGWTVELPIPNWVRPLGISFFVFEAISYTVDIIRKRERIHSFWDFQLFIAFFPKLIAGPILRAKELLPQIENPAKKLRAADVQNGLWLLATGLFLKIVVADGVAQYVDDAFARSPKTLGAMDAWLMAIAFGIQIYMDFSSYTRMALGSAQLCGIQLVENFNYPYSARSPVDFWNRWHMSLSRWIRDYLFFPLVGKQPSLATLCRAAILSMTICGIWHRPGWTYVLWGFYHGVLICGYHLLTYRGRQTATSPTSETDGAPPSLLSQIRSGAGVVAAMAVTFALVMLGWLWFRPQNVADSLALWGRALMPWKFTLRALPGMFYVEIALLMSLIWLAPWLTKRLESWLPAMAEGTRPLWRDLSGAIARGAAMGLMLVLCLLFFRTQTAFIYFQY